MGELIGETHAPHTKTVRRELTRDLGSWFALASGRRNFGWLMRGEQQN